MENEKEFTKEELEMYLRAVLEKTIYSKDLLAEILPLIEEVFIADFELTKEGIILDMLNGQKFKITIEEIIG
ncbi:MAG: hypothetical protein K2M75_05280 [Clostridia bacterium]|nr:hypothetical protein [Clostridia bacterium]